MALAVGCAPVNTDPGSEVERTWQQALVFFPKRFSYLRPSEISVRDPHPTVVYLHGCTGITGQDIFWATTLAQAGYAVVMPNSFARHHRRKNCNPRMTSMGLFPEALRMRDEEIRHAVAMLQSSPWVDVKNLFLMGHSEGGAAVSRWYGHGFKALIISGNECRAGIPAPHGAAILAVEVLCPTCITLPT
ncbi:MAG TPA: dienelactone hydrolase family protein [Candidatus Binatia bacterium]|jgi:dienelactone hydrolase|nr:dienelactone hydrolase family protein [Candidatus Binatia bacterium]